MATNKKLFISAMNKKKINSNQKHHCFSRSRFMTSVYDIMDIKLLTRLHIDRSPLNKHIFRDLQEGKIMPITSCNCPFLTAQRKDLFGQVSNVGYNVANVNSKDSCHFLLYENPNGSNQILHIPVIIKATKSYNKTFGRYSQIVWNNIRELLTQKLLRTI